MIDPKKILDTFTSLVSVDAPSYAEREMCDKVKERLDRLGISYEEDEAGRALGGNCGNLLARVPGKAGLEPILFCAHFDTVEPSRGKKAVVHENGLITSGGDTVLGADDLAGITAILEAVEELLQSGQEHPPLELLFTVAEEAYCYGIREVDFSKIESKEAYVFDLTGQVGHAAVAAPTMLGYTAAFTGKPAHAGFEPEKGIHAIRAAAAAMAKIPCGRDGDLRVNIGTVKGGTQDNIVPEKCVFTGEVRSSVEEHAQVKMEEIRQIVMKAAEEYGAEAEFTVRRYSTAYHTPEEHPVVRRFEEACRKTGVEPVLEVTYGGSDNNEMSLHGIRGIVVATAMMNCHGCNEYTTLEEMTRATHIAYELMRG